MADQYILIASNGFQIDTYGPYINLEDAQEQMHNLYDELVNVGGDDMLEMSGIGEMDAIVYSGEEVWSYQILSKNRMFPKEKGEHEIIQVETPKGLIKSTEIVDEDESDGVFVWVDCQGNQSSAANIYYDKSLNGIFLDIYLNNGNDPTERYLLDMEDES